jgi:hypothetical protein
MEKIEPLTRERYQRSVRFPCLNASENAPYCSTCYDPDMEIRWQRDIFRVDAIFSELRLWRGRARFIEKFKGIR